MKELNELLLEYGYGFMQNELSTTTLLIWDSSDERMRKAKQNILNFILTEKHISFDDGYTQAKEHYNK